MYNERSTDQFVRDELRKIGFPRPWEQSCRDAPRYIYDALEGASKGKGEGRGKPEFVVESGGFLVVIEDKPSIEHSKLLDDDGKVVTEYPARRDYALNGATHYAKYLADRTGKPVFAVGVAGPESHNEISVAFVEAGNEPRLLPTIDAFTDFAESNIEEYYRVVVMGELPREEREVQELRKVAESLHEDMRNYASLEGERKATLISAILLALRYKPDLENDLVGDEKAGYKDGEKVFKAVEEYLNSEEADVKPRSKIDALMDQFSFIRTHVLLNRPNKDLGNKTPLRKFVEDLDGKVVNAAADSTKSAFDVLGSFYGEFVRYGGSDGNALGIVLTPHHVTDLMAELIDVDADDIVIDPCAGTAAFLIAAMRRMIADAERRYTKDKYKTEVIQRIKSKQLHGVELQDKLFAIGITNMILRGDGKANFQRQSIFDLDLHALRGDIWNESTEQWEPGPGFTKVLLNPPYSQAKNETTRHLSELSFITRALDLLNHKGRLAAIVPLSAMVGKTKEDRALKARILGKHTLDAVITMNPDTFHGVGTQTVIVLFTAGVPHPADKKVAFINFKDDGYAVRPHIGLVADGNEKSKRAHLMSVLKDGAPDESAFVVRSEVTAEDEWLHSYFYFNDQPPQLEDFLKTAADYLIWQVEAHARGFGDVIASESKEDAPSSEPTAEDPLPAQIVGPEK